MNYDIFYQDDCDYNIKSKDFDPLKDYLIKKKGWIYIAYSANNNLLKIGRTSKSPLERAKTLSTTGVLHDYNILFSLPVFNQFIVESRVHNRLKKFKISKEFFSVNEKIAIQIIQEEYEQELLYLNRFFNTEIISECIDLLPHAIR
jgi:hypothetical protein